MSDIEISRTIAASPLVLFEMVTDLPRMGEWSPENLGGRWVKGSIGPGIGASFQGANQNGKKAWTTTCIVDEFDPGKAFAFRVTVGPIKVARWRYQFDAIGDATKVTETWEDQRGWLAKKMAGPASGVRDRLSHNRAGMQTTLDNLARVAEADGPVDDQSTTS